MNTFLIIDGNAMMHRAYHALPPLTDKQGQQVNAVYGFFSMLLKVLEEVKPAYLAVCFDRPAPTFRKSLFAGYQAHRPQMADDLSSQFVILHSALEKIGVSIFELDGYEADDLIGTLANQAIHSELRTNNRELFIVKIVTGDRDLLQLVNDRVHILFPILGITKMTEYDEKSVEEKFGVKSEQFIDYKALIGDASDGYPGVTGIGPKTASNLLQTYHSFENIYENISSLPPKTAEKLVTDAEQAALAKKLATILTDAPIALHFETCSLENIDRGIIEEVFDNLSFESLKKRLGNVEVIRAKKEKTGEQMSLL